MNRANTHIFAGPDRYGAAYAPGLCAFSVFADADAVRVRLVHPGSRQTILRELDPDRSVESAQGGALWHVEIPRELYGWSYTYEIEREGKTLGDIVDPWALLVREGRGYIVGDTTAVTRRPALDPSEAIIYELHIRDFTRDPDSGVRPDWRGRYLGLTQTGTTLAGTDYPSALDHIKELGVTVVQLMPVHSFCLPYHPAYEWGYMPTDFNAPHAGYASSVEVDAPIREFKRLVSALHESGLRVTLDVVYNHTAERWPNQLRSLMALAPREYFRFKDDGSAWDGSACGNEFRSESPQGRRFILDSVDYWAREYGVDGFRFDLMGLIDARTMELVAQHLHDIDPTILVYGEPWAGGPTPIEITEKGTQRDKGWGVFNDEMRDGLRGDVFEPTDVGFLVAGEDITRVKQSIVGGVTSFADSPLETINYLECHDNHTLVDRLKLTAPPTEKFTKDQRLAMNTMGAMILLTSQGIPFLHSGQEFGRTKEGKGNSYNLGDQINNIRWKDKAQRYRLFAFYKDLVRMRRKHPMFRLSTRDDVVRAVRFLDDDLGCPLPPGTIGYVLQDVTGDDAWSHALMLFNGTSKSVQMPLPAIDGAGSDQWTLAMLDGRAAGEPTAHAQSFALGAHYGAVLYTAR